ncbi:MAG: tetratricopeptide repeat protein [Pseudomonadota bacterium]
MGVDVSGTAQNAHKDGAATRAILKRCALGLVLPSALLLGACAQTGLTALSDATTPLQKAQASPAETQKALQEATYYWGKEFSKDPRNAKKAIAYAKNLKAMGQKRRALAVLQQASMFNGNNVDLISEYGRLALDVGQVQIAHKLLAKADIPSRPDWKVISARGASYAKLGKHAQAVRHFERAIALAPNQPSVLNNLALAYALNGNPGKAETLLRKAAASDNPALPRIRQNLALVLGLQGKYAEAKQLAQRDLGQARASQNIAAIRQMVALPPKPAPAPAATQPTRIAKPTALATARPVARPRPARPSLTRPAAPARPLTPAELIALAQAADLRRGKAPTPRAQRRPVRAAAARGPLDLKPAQR